MQKYQVFLSSIFIILLSNTVLAEIKINEVMYNPKGSDNYKEFVEIYNPDKIDLTNVTISDGDSEDKLVKLNDINSEYALIVETSYVLDIPKDISLYSAGASIGNGLSEDDKVSLYDKNKTEMCSMQIFKIEEGYSLEYFNENYYKSLYLNGTPGSENSIKEIPKEETQEESDNESSEETTDTTSLNQTSTIEIKNIPENIKFGDNISIEVSVYRGSTNKYALYFYIEKDNSTKLTDKISEHARKKYTNYNFNYSVQLKDNCNNKYEEGKYYIILEGLDLEVSEEVDLSKNQELCGIQENTTYTDFKEVSQEEFNTKETSIETKTESNINTNPEKITGNVVYESSDFKAKDYAIYFLSFILILVIVYLLFRKNEKVQINNQSSN